MDKRDQLGLGVGGAFTALVVGLLITLFTKRVEVETVGAKWSEAPDVRICDTAPTWVKNETEGVVATLTAQGLRFGTVTTGPCIPCAYVVKGKVKTATCDDGAISIDLRNQWFSESHVDETLLELDHGRVLRASVMLPERITDERIASEDQRRFPTDAYRLALAHGLVHGRGYGHSFTRVSKGVIAHKQGELMHPELLGMGWGFGGLP
jgi:hypothetical protein